MFFLLFFVFLIQIFNYWIFQPFTFFLTHFLESRLLPIIAFLVFSFLFSLKTKN